MTTTLLILFALSGLPAPPGALVFEDVRVVTLTEAGVLEHARVVVEDGRIAALGPAAEVTVPDGARIVPGDGATLVPGLMDLHVHVGDRADLELFVLHGVTTVHELGGDPWHLELRRRLAAGEIEGPTLHVGSPPIVGVTDPGDADALAREHAAAGYTDLKLYDDLSVEAYGALVEAARRHGLRPLGHVPRNLRVEDVLATPPDAVSHAEEFLYGWFGRGHGDDSVQELARQVHASGAAVVTTLTTYDLIGRQVADLPACFERADVRFASALQLRDWGPERNRHRHFPASSAASFRRNLALLQRLVGSLHDAGVPVLLGTDGGSAGIPFVLAGSSVHDELSLLVASGLSPEAALAAATRDAARFLGVGDQVGTLAPGRVADLLLVAGDPLQDVGALRDPLGVMVRGRWIPQDEIAARLDGLALQGRLEAEFMTRLEEQGAPLAVAWAAGARSAQGGLPPFREASLNELAYEALKLHGRVDDAVTLFAHNARVYAEEWNVHDSLGEALLARGDVAGALEAYREAVRLNPRHADGLAVIAELEDALAER